MQLLKRGIDWNSFAFALVVFGLPIFLVGLTFFPEPRWSSGMQLLIGLTMLAFRNRSKLVSMVFPFSTTAGRGSARYLAMLGLAWYTFGRIQLIPESNFMAQELIGLLLIGLAAAWYLIRMLRFGEKSL